MHRRLAMATAVLVLVGAAATGSAQQAPPAPGGGGRMGPGGMMGQGMGGMMGHEMPGMRGMPGGDHLEHLMVHDPKAAARLMRFRADMLRAMSEVLQRHAAELEKAQ
jgi:hypothetical protein